MQYLTACIFCFHMSQSFLSDDRGIIVPCPACGAANRVAYARLAQQGRCGVCKVDLSQPTAPVEISSPTAFSSLISESPLPVVIDFWAPWCGPCQMMAPEFAKAAAQAVGEAVFVKVNTDEHPEIASPFRIQGIPAFALVKGGQVVSQSSGFQPAPRLLAWIRQHA